MGDTQPDTTRGTVHLTADNVASRTIRIRKTLAEVRSAWSAAQLPGTPEFVPAPLDRGIDLRVELDKETTGSDAEHLLSPYEGGSIDQRLESALRALKARLETGEIATTEGQSSGRSD